MFWNINETADHGLPRNPWKACVVPRPIGWITTISDDGEV
ncbi:MAG TPA: flavin reductase, partial [Rhodospirillaceae bacterium]|nr:flavin reductase [Rhodospirillaceae bacterium]